jgi:hypothetical protein
MLATQDRELVAQHQDFDLLGLSMLAAESDQLKAAAHRQVDERPDHTGPPPRKASKRRRILVLRHAELLVTTTIGFWHPTRRHLASRSRGSRSSRAD